MVVVVLAIIILGPERMITMARTSSKLIQSFWKAADQLPRSLADIVPESDSEPLLFNDERTDDLPESHPYQSIESDPNDNEPQ